MDLDVKDLAFCCIEERFPPEVASNDRTIPIVHDLTIILTKILLDKYTPSHPYIALRSLQKSDDFLVMEMCEHPLYPNCVVLVFESEILQTTAIKVPISI